MVAEPPSPKRLPPRLASSLRASARFLFHTLGLRFLLALITAFALWLFVARDASPTGAPGYATGSYRTVSVVVKLHGTPADGYGVTGVLVTPPTLTIQGAALSLGDVSFLNTEVMDITGVTATQTRVVTVDLPPGISSISTPMVTVSVYIAPIPGKVTADVPVSLKGLGPGLISTLSPDQVNVTLSGPLPRLNSLSIRAVVDVTSLAPGIYNLPVQVAAPNDVTVQLTPADVTVTLTQVRAGG